MLYWFQTLRLLFNSSPQQKNKKEWKKKLTAPWKSFHLAIPKWHYHIQFGKGKTKTKPVCQILTQEIEWAKHCDACWAAHWGERRVTYASQTRSASSQLKSASTGSESYFWRVSDVNTTIVSTPSKILVHCYSAQHSLSTMLHVIQEWGHGRQCDI